jgi:hypothetical protein
MKKIVLLLSLYLFSFANDLVLIEKNNLEIAKLDFINGNYTKSYEKLKKLFLNNPSNYELNYHFAKSAVKIKKFGMASAAYERILINEVNNLEIKFEQAKLLYLSGNPEASIISLKRLLEEDLSISLNKSVKDYLDFTRQNKKLFSIDATFLFSLNYNDNVTNAPEEKYILEDFDYLGVQGTDEISDINHLEYINIDISKKLDNYENISFINNFTYFIRTYLDEKDENLEFYSYKPAVTIKDDSKLYYLGAMFERYQPGNEASDDYFDSVGFETRVFNKNYRFDLKAQRFFYRGLGKKEKNYSRYHLGFRTFNRYGFNFSSNITKDISLNSTRTDIDKITSNNNLSYTFKLSDSIDIEPSLRYQMSKYEDISIAFNTKRKDKLGKIGFEVKKYIDKSSFLSLQTSYLNNESNQEEYDYESKTIGLLYVKKFTW